MADILRFPLENDAAQAGAPHTVLVVDDEPAIRGVLCEFLTECGLIALTAENADQALALIRQGVAIDLVFSDVRMPGTMDGCGLARWMRKNRPEIPVILATGDLGKANAAAGLSGIATFAKPYDFGAALRKIRQTISDSKSVTDGRNDTAQDDGRADQSLSQVTSLPGSLPAARI